VQGEHLAQRVVDQDSPEVGHQNAQAVGPNTVVDPLDNQVVDGDPKTVVVQRNLAAGLEDILEVHDNQVEVQSRWLEWCHL